MHALALVPFKVVIHIDLVDVLELELRQTLPAGHMVAVLFIQSIQKEK